MVCPPNFTLCVEINLNNGDAEKNISGSMHSDGSLPPTGLYSFGEFVPLEDCVIDRGSSSKESKLQPSLDTSKSTSEYEFGSSLGEFAMGSYGETSNPSGGFDSYYNPVCFVGPFDVLVNVHEFPEIFTCSDSFYVSIVSIWGNGGK